MKLKLLFLSILAIFVFTGCGKSNIENISYSKLNKMLENEETFFFVVTRDGCSHCEEFIPKLEAILEEYDITGYNLNISNMTEEEFKEFNSKYNVEGTPTTIFIAKGKETSLLQRIDGNVSKDKIISKLETNNYIKK